MRCFVIMGVAGCGKTSVGEAVAADDRVIFVDGDALHPAANIAKMSAGTPLTDSDRAPWLRLVGEEMAHADGPIALGCSALKRTYRNQITESSGEAVGFLHLAAPMAVIAERMASREGHFMPTSLLESQYDTLEPLGTDEFGQTFDISKPFDEVVSSVRDYITESMT